MGKNYIPEVEKILGVEIGEEFNLLNEDGEVTTGSPYKFEDNAFINCYGTSQSHVLIKILRGDYTIQEPPWKPEQGNLCWFIKTDGTVYLDRFMVDSQHLSMLNIGNCFSEASEAEAHIEEMVEKYKKIEMKMVKW